MSVLERNILATKYVAQKLAKTFPFIFKFYSDNASTWRLVNLLTGDVVWDMSLERFICQGFWLENVCDYVKQFDYRFETLQTEFGDS